MASQVVGCSLVLGFSLSSSFIFLHGFVRREDATVGDLHLCGCVCVCLEPRSMLLRGMNFCVCVCVWSSVVCHTHTELCKPLAAFEFLV
jgi:hypothetical protein